MRSKDLKQGLVVALVQGQLSSYNRPEKATVLSTEPWMTKRSYGSAEDQPWPEDVFHAPGMRWTSHCPEKARSWTESTYSGFGGKRSAGALVVTSTGLLQVVPLSRIKGEWEAVSAEHAELVKREGERRVAKAEARHELSVRFALARETANLLLESRGVAPISEYSHRSDGQGVLLTLEQFEHLVADAL